MSENQSYADSVANRLEREMGARQALLYVKSIAEQNKVDTSCGISSIVSRLALKGIKL